MAVLEFDVTNPPVQRNRLTVGLRIFYAIPHLILAGIWNYLAQFLTLLQWFVVLFTGKRHQGMWNMQQQFLLYYGRVLAYLDLLYDEPYPPFGTDAGTVPVHQALAYEEQANRLTCALRFIWIIPAAIISIFVGIGATVLTIVSWFAILFTGKQSPGMYDFIKRSARFYLQVQAYGFLMTDTYPKFS